MPIVISGTNGISGVDGTASNPSYEGTDANTGVFFPAADTVAIGTNGTEALRVNSSQNVGVGVTPSAWWSSLRALQVGSGGSLMAYASINPASLYLTSNAYYDGATYRYIGTSTAAQYSQFSGSHNWYGAASGTAGAAFNFTQLLSVELGRSLALEGATIQTGTGITFPATQNASSNANTLDDYEEGTFTPSALVSITGAIGRYTKIGRVVQWSCCFTMSSNANGNAAYIGNLPFLCENNNGARAGSVISFTDYGSSNITILFAANDVSAYFYNYSGIALTNANLSGKTIFCGGTYLTNT